MARTFASLGAYIATVSDTGLQLHQYASSTVTATLDRGVVGVRVSTDYPADGLVRVEITDTVEGEWELGLRVPGWARSGATLTVDGASQPVGPGTVSVRRAFAVGDVVQLSLPVTARWSAPDPRIDALRGQLAVERGPLVLCLESTDAPSLPSVNEARIVPELAEQDGVVTVGVRRLEVSDLAWPYGTNASHIPASPGQKIERVVLRPYHSWANRGPSTMRVWMPVEGSDSLAPGDA